MMATSPSPSLLSPVIRMQMKAMTGMENLARLSNMPEITSPWATSDTPIRKLRYIR